MILHLRDLGRILRAMRVSLGRRIALLGGLIAAGAGLVVAQGPNADAARLASVVDEYMAHAAAAGGGLARGVSPDRVAGLSVQRAHEESAWAAGMVKKLADVHPAELTHDQWITYSDLLFDVTGTADADRYFWFVTPVTPYPSPLRVLTTPFESVQFKTATDAETYLDALNQVPIVIGGYEAKLRGQMQRGIVLPADEIQLVLPFVRTLVVEPPRSAFSVAASRVSALPGDAAVAFQRNVDDTIRQAINPSIQRLVTFIDTTYRAHAPARVGVSQYAGRRRLLPVSHSSAHRARNLTPQQIQDIGVAEIARLEGELDKVRVAAGFSGSFAEFRTFLKTDRRFFPKSSEDIGVTMMAAIRRIEPKIDSYFILMPKAPYGVSGSTNRSSSR